MALPRALLDTDILSAVMKGNPAVIARARAYLAEHGALAFFPDHPPRDPAGLKAKRRRLSLSCSITSARPAPSLPLTDEIVVRAADIYATLKERGSSPWWGCARWFSVP